MNQHLFAVSILLLLMGHSLGANVVSRRAAMVAHRGDHKCTLQVNVDGAAEVEIWGDTAELRTLSGQDAFWRRFECTALMPQRAADFRLVSITGRGAVSLVRDSRTSRGRAVVRVDDPQGGRGVYTFDLVWRGSPAPGWTPGWTPGPAPPPPPPAFAVQACQDAVSDRLRQSGYPSASFGRIDSPNGRAEWVSGIVTARRRSVNAPFSYSCSVDFRSGRVRSVDVQRQ
jgi:hypothetical protein